MCANSEGTGETARMRRLTWDLAGRQCDKYHNIMSWLIIVFHTCLTCRDVLMPNNEMLNKHVNTLYLSLVTCFPTNATISRPRSFLQWGWREANVIIRLGNPGYFPTGVGRWGVGGWANLSFDRIIGGGGRALGATSHFQNYFGGGGWPLLHPPPSPAPTPMCKFLCVLSRIKLVIRTSEVTRQNESFYFTESCIIVSSCVHSRILWTTSRENLSLGVCDQIRHKPACSATETS